MRIIFLDYLRIFAFMSVLIGHIYYDALEEVAHNQSLHVTLRTIAEGLLPFTLGGGAGVVVFFLVSGYIITHVLQKETPAEFAIKRIFRIYPLYMVAATLWLVTDRGTPTWSTIVPQLLLVGDLFKTPYALNEVEWTLRIEVVFYLFMGTAKYLGLLDRWERFLPAVMAMTTLTLFLLPPLPGPGITKQGYITLYAPFLLLGSLIYLREKNSIGSLTLTAITLQIFLQYFEGIRTFQPLWLNTHFAVLGFLTFMGCWYWRAQLPAPKGVRWLSDLTFSVYLFHFWLMELIRKTPIVQALPPTTREAATLITFFACCYAFHQLIERKGIRVGQWLNAQKYRYKPVPKA